LEELTSGFRRSSFEIRTCFLITILNLEQFSNTVVSNMKTGLDFRDKFFSQEPTFPKLITFLYPIWRVLCFKETFGHN
jgi:hypothetical protein